MTRQPIKLADVIRDLMEIFTRRRELEQRARESRASEAEGIELKAINARLKG